jgi:phytoene synthase
MAKRRLSIDHYENFPVASALLPKRFRRAVAAIYRFARAADDIADEGSATPAARHAALAEFSLALDAIERGETPVRFAELAHAVRAHALPLALFRDLLSAFGQDVDVTRYPTFAAVLDYCRRSANPIGRLVLRVAGYDDPRLDRASDAVCTALQLTNFWQDLARDRDIGRVYVPIDERRRTGASDDDLAAGRMTPEWQRVMAEMTGRTRRLFADGRAVCDGVRGRLRWELRATWLGGMRILDKLERAGFDVFHHRPRLGASDLPGLAAGTLLWR